MSSLFRSLLAATAALAACSPGPEVTGGTSEPAFERVVLIVVDTLRRDHVSAYGGATPTPNIDALARKGQVFSNAVASFHQTTMSMAALFTGRTPSLETGTRERSIPFFGFAWCGMYRLRTPDQPTDVCIPPELTSLAEHYRRAGYWTAGVVANALLFAPQGYERGFDLWREVGQPSPDPAAINTDALARTRQVVTAELTRTLKERPSDRFFLYVHLMDVHDFKPLDVSYASGVAEADRGVGDVVALLESNGLRDDALIVVVSDHGERLKDIHLVRGLTAHYGNPSFEEHLRVPLIASPGLGVSSDAFVRSTDLHRMLAKVAGGEGPPDDLQDDELFVSEGKTQTYRRGHFKSYRARKRGELVLIDLSTDPEELVDVAAANPRLARFHKLRMETLTRELAPPHEVPTDVTPSDEDRRRLEALGYLH